MADQQEIKVTIAMIDAGAPILLRFRLDTHNEDVMVAEIYRAMRRLEKPLDV